MDKLTRKELKSDKFAQEVQHSVEYVSGHRRQMVQWGLPGIAVVLIIIGVFWYRNHQHGVRQEALRSAMVIQNSTVGPSQSQYISQPRWRGETRCYPTGTLCLSLLCGRIQGALAGDTGPSHPHFRGV